MMRSKKGFTHTLESIMATFVVLGFLVLIMPVSQEPSVKPRTITTYVHEALRYLDANGMLRAYAISGNTTGISSELDSILPAWISNNVTITYMNSTVSSLSTNSEYNFTVDDIDYAYVYLWLDNATDISVYINDSLACIYSGTYLSQSKECDITSDAGDGDNRLKLNATSLKFVNRYELRLWKSEGSTNLPENKTIQTVTYFVAGEDNIYRPTEIFVQVWG